MKEMLEQQKNELVEDIDTLVTVIEELEEQKPENWEEQVEQEKQILEQLEKNLDAIIEQLDPTPQDSDHDSFIVITDRMINETIEEYFRYYIWTHPVMIKAVGNVQTNGPKALEKYPQNIRKWINIFTTAKYKNKKKIEEEWMIHKTWVCFDDPTNPFSFKNCVEYRGVTSPWKLRKHLDELAYWSLQQLIERHEVFHKTTQKQEKENVLAIRKVA